MKYALCMRDGSRMDGFTSGDRAYTEAYLVHCLKSCALITVAYYEAPEGPVKIEGYGKWRTA